MNEDVLNYTIRCISLLTYTQSCLHVFDKSGITAIIPAIQRLKMHVNIEVQLKVCYLFGLTAYIQKWSIPVL